MAVYALDTNIVIHYLYNEQSVIRNLEKAIDCNHNMVIPYIVEYEMRRGFEIKAAPNNEVSYNELAWGSGFCNVVTMGDNFWPTAARVYAELYRKRLTVGDLDILIAAFCLHNDYILVSANTRHFKDIEGLNLVDWTQPHHSDISTEVNHT